jgi:hypothetical protein
LKKSGIKKIEEKLNSGDIIDDENDLDEGDSDLNLDDDVM